MRIYLPDTLFKRVTTARKFNFFKNIDLSSCSIPINTKWFDLYRVENDLCAASDAKDSQYFQLLYPLWCKLKEN